jgi:hypothetical protein
LELLKAEQDRIGIAEQAAKAELEAAEGGLEGWQDVLRPATRLAGNCHAAHLKARPSVRRRFNDTVLGLCTSRTDGSAERSSRRCSRRSSHAQDRVRP